MFLSQLDVCVVCLYVRRGALRLVFGPTLFGAGDVAVLDQGCVAELHSLVVGHLLVLDEAVLLEVLLALLLLLRVEVGGVGGVALLAIAAMLQKI